jgi:hypothetical protein
MLQDIFFFATTKLIKNKKRQMNGAFVGLDGW